MSIISYLWLFDYWFKFFIINVPVILFLGYYFSVSAKWSTRKYFRAAALGFVILILGLFLLPSHKVNLLKKSFQRTVFRFLTVEKVEVKDDILHVNYLIWSNGYVQGADAQSLRFLIPCLMALEHGAFTGSGARVIIPMDGGVPSWEPQSKLNIWPLWERKIKVVKMLVQLPSQDTFSIETPFQIVCKLCNGEIQDQQWLFASKLKINNKLVNPVYFYYYQPRAF